MSGAAPVGRPTTTQIAHLWDAVAETRLRQIESGIDISYRKILQPAILSALPTGRRVLDVGCGIGVATAAIAALSAEVVGIDPSHNSIQIANEHFLSPNLTYLCSSIEDFARLGGSGFDVVTSNMVLMDVPNLDEALMAIRQLCEPQAAFIATITHPCFWPKYFGYESENWFQYDREIFIDSEFIISAEVARPHTIHTHRPLQIYFAGLARSGFENVHLTELYGPGSFAFPRFLRIVATAN